MQYRSRFLKVLAGVSVPAIMLMVWAGCSKTEQTVPSVTNDAVGEAKLQSDPFITINAGPTVSFHICSPYQQIVTNNPGPSIPYICSGSGCTAQQIGIKIGVSPNVFCFNPEQIYWIKADTGPANRQTLKFKFPTGYNECTLNPATGFNYNSTLGTWSLGTAANGVLWTQGNSTCP